MSGLDCGALRAWMDENVGGATSWVEFGPRLDVDQQEHFSACLECRERCLQLLELERQLLALREEPLPELDLSAGVMARIRQPQAPARSAAAQGFSLWAWAPSLLLLLCLLPDPEWLPAWLGWSWVWPQIEIPALSLPVDFSLALAACMGMWLAATWKWRQSVRA